jgi:hypothetical protein
VQGPDVAPPPAPEQTAEPTPEPVAAPSAAETARRPTDEPEKAEQVARAEQPEPEETAPDGPRRSLLAFWFGVLVLGAAALGWSVGTSFG